MSDTRAAVIGAIGVGAIAAASFFSGGPDAPQGNATPAVDVAPSANPHMGADAGTPEQEIARRHPGRAAAMARARERMVKRVEREKVERAKAQEGHGPQ